MVDFKINVNLGKPPSSGLFIVLTKHQISNDINHYIVGQYHKVKTVNKTKKMRQSSDIC
jgi:hypothetical protein